MIKYDINVKVFARTRIEMKVTVSGDKQKQNQSHKQIPVFLLNLHDFVSWGTDLIAPSLQASATTAVAVSLLTTAMDMYLETHTYNINIDLTKSLSKN
jgi:hypothetical protein